MVIEHFKGSDPSAVGERFKVRGRMLPEGVTYLVSWMEETGARCFQIMEAPDRAALDPWLRSWDDLVDFEIILVLTSADFWSRRSSVGGS